MNSLSISAEPQGQLTRELYDVDAERLALASMLRSVDAVADVMETVTVDDFAVFEHRQIFTAILRLYAESPARVTIQNVAHELADPHGWLDKSGGERF